MAECGKNYHYMLPSAYEENPTGHVTYKLVWDGLRERTSAHGIPHIDNAKGIFKKTFWGVITLGTCCFLFYNSQYLFKKFLKYDVNVNVELVSSQGLDFPAVTVCNMNPLKKSALSQSSELNALLGGGGGAKRRRKRALDLDCSVSGRVNPETGICFALYDPSVGDKKFSDAQTRCTAEGFTLPIVDSQAKSDWLIDNRDNFMSGNQRDVWLWMERDTSWQVAGGAEVQWTHYWSGTRETGSTDCVYARISIFKSGNWAHINCNSRKRVLCQKLVECPSAVETSSGMCYFLWDQTTQYKQSDAAHICTQIGAHLAILDTQAKVDHVKAITPLNTITSGTYWINLKKISGTYNWNSNTPLGSYSNFASGTVPVSATDCVIADLAQNHEWEPADCSSEQHLVLCMWQADDPVTTEATTTTTTTVPTTTTTTTEPTTTTTTTQPTTTSTTTEPTTTTTTTQPTTTTTTTQPTTTTTTTQPTTTTTTTEPTTTTTTTQPTTTTTTTQPTTTTTTTQPTTTTTTTQPTTTTTTTQPTTTTTATEPTTTTTTTQPTTTTTTTEPTTTTTTTEPTTTTTTTEPTSTTTTTEPTTTTTTTEPTTTTTTTEPTTTTTTTDPTTTDPTTTTTTTNPTTTTTTTEPTTTTTVHVTTSTIPTTTTTEQQITTTTKQMTTTYPNSTYYLIELSTGLGLSTTLETSTPEVTTDISTSTFAEPTTTTKAPPTTTTAGPQPLVGSRFPERVAPREEFAREEKVTQILADLPLEAKQALGYTTEEFLLDCAYSGVSCYPDDFTTFYNPMHGNCYTFNSGWNSSNRLYISHRTGRRYGLQITVNIGQDEYIDGTSNSAGARVVVHERTRMPFPEDEGFIVRPGSLSSVGLRKLSIQRKGHPHGNCTNMKIDTENFDRNVFQEIYNATYSVTACQKTCYQNNVIHTCKCADPNYPMKGEAFGNINVSACDASNLIEDDCKYEITQKYIKDELDCNCPNPCGDDVFIPQVSAAIWPSDVSQNTIVNKLKSKIPFLSTSNDAEKIRRNLLQLEIYYEEFNYEKIYEKPAYDFGTFASDMGGILGLYVGFSIMTIFEFFELAMDMCMVSCRKLRGRNNIGPPSKLEEIRRKSLAETRARGRPGTATARRRRKSSIPMLNSLPGSPPPYSSSTSLSRVFHARSPKEPLPSRYKMQTPQGVDRISLELV